MRKNIFKKLALITSLVTAFTCTCGITAFADEDDIAVLWNNSYSGEKNTHYIYDNADFFSDSEEAELQEMYSKVGAELGLDIVVVTTEELGYGDDFSTDSEINSYEMQYADDFYDYNGFSESGLLLLIDEDYGGIYISTAGLAMVYLNDADIESLIDSVWEAFSDYDYYEVATDFIDAVDDMIGSRKSDNDYEELEDKWEAGGYEDYDDFENVYYNEIMDAHKDTFFTKFQNPLVSLGIAAVIALIAVLIMCISSSSKMTAGSKTYMKKGSFNVLRRFDRFTHTTTTSRTVSSSSGGGGGGGTSSHRSSSGRSHGGGGRRR